MNNKKKARGKACRTPQKCKMGSDFASNENKGHNEEKKD